MTPPASPPAHLIRVDSPVGRLEIGGDGRAIVSLSIEADGHLPWEHLPESPDPVLRRAAEQLAEYFEGERHRFELPVELGGTAFQLAVWEQLVDLEWGEVVSYGELGRGTGRASAGRAVGGAIRANPVPIIVPCHRVVGRDGAITGYSAGEGLSTKRWLLAHEGASAAAGAPVAADAEATGSASDEGPRPGDESGASGGPAPRDEPRRLDEPGSLDEPAA